MDVTVRVQLDAARALQRQQHTAMAAELLRAAQELGVILEPLHPGADDPYLVPYFTVAVPSQAAAKRVIDRLMRCRAIEAAYVKPPDELP